MKVRHYKGGIYTVLIDMTEIANHDEMENIKSKSGVLRAFHTEKEEEVFAYRLLGGTFYTEGESLTIYQNEDGRIFARPADMFWEFGYFNEPYTLEPRFAII